jgi:hypothetical protein
MLNKLATATACFFAAQCFLPAVSQAGWADSLFSIKTHDFGTVAVAAKTEFDFPIVNNTGRDIHISNVRASCGCTTPIVEEQWIKAGAQGKVTARFNTGSFRGKKGATLTVVFDRPSYAEVQLRVDGYIRQDMVLHPGSVDFGKVKPIESESQERRISIAYAGRSDWRITGVETPVPYLNAEVVEKTRNGQRVDYELIVRLAADAPQGALRNELIITTNDRSMPRVPVSIDGEVQAAFTIAPQVVDVGSLKPGEDYSQRLVIRSSTAFKVTKIECEGFEVDFQPSDSAKDTHLINVRLVAQDRVGPVKSNLVVFTDSDEAATTNALVTGQVVGQ